MTIRKIQSILGLIVGLVAIILTIIWFGWKLALIFFMFGYAGKADIISWVKYNYGDTYER